jgi:hypothetical protein
MGAVLAPGPVTQAPRSAPEPRLSPNAFIARVLWKRQYLPRRSTNTRIPAPFRDVAMAKRGT